MRCGPAVVSSSSTTARPLPARRRPLSPPTSSPRAAFWNASWKLRPIAITSPTDFICVVRRLSEPGNLANAKRGSLTTT